MPCISSRSKDVPGALWGSLEQTPDLVPFPTSTAQRVTVGSEGICLTRDPLKPENGSSRQVLSHTQSSDSTSHHLLTLLRLDMTANRE